MPLKYQGAPSLSSLGESWEASRDTVRIALQRIDQALRQLYSGSNPLGSGNPTPQNIGGLGGGEVSINQVNENEPLNNRTEGILDFGRGDTDSLAHAIRVNSDGEILLAHLPGTTLAAAYSNSQAVPTFISMIGTIPYGVREIDGPDSGRLARLTVGQYAQYPDNLGYDSGGAEATETGDVGLQTMDSPKVYSSTFTEFNKSYRVGGTQTQGMTTGSHESGTKLGVWRFRRGAIAFSSGVSGTPNGIVRILLRGYGGAGGAYYVLHCWIFDADDFVDGVFNRHFLRFDVETPLIDIQIYTDNSAGAGNTYDVANFMLFMQS